ncbi:hypothetical protein [Acidianus sp. HS-5]|uniref:hypothetical protein n=1 Tax=Acidianus sp. HS-5 TaxID=2886040 RepID=UPI001F47EF74|nr:hypothetical protein [Acidianus sp. HS-5]BDC17926.1 hypothetical protein HS5_08160 [Acidianus sp. HS-5]
MRKLTTEEYLNEYLPKLNEKESYLFYLISRDREAKEQGLKIDKVLYRVWNVETLKAVKILLSIRDNVEFEVRGIKIRKEWIKVMHVLNPVNMSKASKDTVVRYMQECERKPDISKIFFSELPRHIDFKIFMVDVDSKDRKIIEQMKDLKPRLVMTTRRGFHIHFWKEDLEDPQILFRLKDVEVKTRDSIEYVPISQGKFTPEAYEIIDIEEINNLIS